MLLYLGVVIIYGLVQFVFTMLRSNVTIAMLIMEFVSFATLLVLFLFDWILDVHLLEIAIVYVTCLFALETIIVATTCMRLLSACIHTDLLY
jgi:hypothetical protein